MNRRITALLGLLAASATVWAAPSPIEQAVQRLQPGSEVLGVKETPVRGLFEVTIKDFDPVYLSEDGRYFLSGQLMQVTDAGKVVNLTDEKKRAERTAALANVPLGDQIIYSPAKPKARIYVFTDVDCGYCRKFHTEIETYVAVGVEVHYLAYPRAGTTGETFETMQSIWCSADRKAALTKVKAGGDLEPRKCASPVAKQYNLGKSMGVKGTPSIYRDDGTQIGGFLTPVQMKKALQLTD